MKVRRFFIGLDVVLAIVNVGFWVAFGHWWSLASATFIASMAGYLFTQERKARRNGSNRRTEEGPQDSSTATCPYGVPGCTCGATQAASSSLSSGGFLPAITWQSITAQSMWPPSPAHSSKPKLEEVEGDVPILAHRSALLRFDGTNKPFGSVSYSERFGVEADAACSPGTSLAISGYIYSTRAAHKAPDVDCRCGFYALPPDMASTYEGHNYVTLMVELSGTVIEHDKGYRAEHQRVIECQLPACPYCGAQADVVVVDDHVMTQTTCTAHTPEPSPGVVFVSVESVTELLPVPVTRAGKARVTS